MTPDDLDLRLRRALDEVSSAWQPTTSSVPELVNAAGRRRARRHRSAMTIGCAVVVGIALVVGAGVYSTTSRTDNRVASSGSLQKSTPPTASGSTASPGLSKRVAPPHQANHTLECASVTVASGSPQCAGVYVSASPASSALFAHNSVAGTADATSTPASLTVPVGQHVTVRLPATALASWRGPVAITASRLSATLGQGLPAGQSPAPPGAVRVVGRVRAGAKRTVTTVFEGTKPGDVVLTATLARACTHAPNHRAKLASPSCTGIPTKWLILLVIVPR